MPTDRPVVFDRVLPERITPDDPVSQAGTLPFGGKGVHDAEDTSPYQSPAAAEHIVLNGAHHPNRQASNLAHELARILLWHAPVQAFSEDGIREWNPEQEAEAQ